MLLDTRDRSRLLPANSKAQASSPRVVSHTATIIAANFAEVGKEACAGYRIAVDTLDSAILSHIAEHVFTEERCREILREFVEDQGVLRQKTADQRRLLERERDELGKRLERWFERIETEPELADVGAERLRELKSKRDEVLRSLAKFKPLHSVPPYLYKPETIQRFQRRHARSVPRR